MSKIAEQIKALQTKQKKIDYLSYILDLVKNDNKCVDYKDIQTEIVSKIEPFLKELMTSIENDLELKSKTKNDLSEEQLNALKLVANKLLEKPEAASAYRTEDKPAPTEVQKAKQELSNTDKMNFAMNNRHLANAEVQIINDKNVEILGTVVGLDAPYVIVKTKTGPTIHVPIEKVVPV